MLIFEDRDTPEKKLSSLKQTGKWKHIHTMEIMSYIHAILQELGPDIRFTPEDVRMNTLQAGGDMVLLME